MTEHRCEASYGDIALERNRYYTGRYLSARDFATDPDYLRSRQHLHHRLLHGRGVVCGLAVTPDERPSCRDRWVTIGPGVALDCHGREIVLAGPAQLELRPDTEEPYLIALRYREHGIEHSPALLADDACAAGPSRANRVRECPEVVLAADDDRCWTVEGSGPAPVAQERGSCLEPDCPCGDLVPLARVVPCPGETPPYRLEVDARPRVPRLSSGLTHIVGLNWEHGGTVSLRTLREEMSGRLEVRFDRALQDAGRGTGIGPVTFQVQYAGTTRALEFLPPTQDPRVEEECLAVFPIEDRFLGERQPNLAGYDVFITLRCDFVLDRYGEAVDGTHLGGQLPTGDGLPGGVFESWFSVVDDGRAYKTGGGQG